MTWAVEPINTAKKNQNKIFLILPPCLDILNMTITNKTRFKDSPVALK